MKKNNVLKILLLLLIISAGVILWKVGLIKSADTNQGYESSQKTSDTRDSDGISASLIILDLDGIKYSISGLDSNIYFDYDGDGIKERMGWVNINDGILFIDLNNNEKLDNGSELFGNQAALKNGGIAKSGFEVLRDNDQNNDGYIDKEDSIWKKLRVWQFIISDCGDVGCEKNYNVSEGSVKTLDQLGIQRINLGYKKVNKAHVSKNTLVRESNYVNNSGKKGLTAEFAMVRDTSDTRFDVYVEIPSDINKLPNIKGKGKLRDLHEVLTLERSKKLIYLIKIFANEPIPQKRNKIFENLLFAWSKSDRIKIDARGPYMDARKIHFLEQIYGRTLKIASKDQALDWEKSYKKLYERYYAEIISQTHLKIYLDAIEIEGHKANINKSIEMLRRKYKDNPIKGTNDIVEFARFMKAVPSNYTPSLSIYRETFIAVDKSLATKMDNVGKM